MVILTESFFREYFIAMDQRLDKFSFNFPITNLIILY